MSEFRHRRGGTLRWVFVKFENDGSPMDLAGATVTCEIEELSPPLRAPLNISVQDSDNGVFVASTPRSETSTWPAGTYRSSVEITWPDGTKLTAGNFEFGIPCRS
ncbi:MAG: hypothetical protein GDA40_06775 [Rhodobacteraceae bacterium]|nr:hypothetical protein [Paracoccaceae bacterium]